MPLGAAARVGVTRARTEGETVGTCSARRSQNSQCRWRTEPRRHTEQLGSLDHRPGTLDSVRTRTYWYTTSAAERMAVVAGVAVTAVARAAARKAVEKEVEVTAAETVAA